MKNQSREELKLWAFSDPHVFKDLYKSDGTLRPDARESLGEAIRQVEQDTSFIWDLAVSAGDFSSSHGLPTAREGKEVVKQFSRLTKHKREEVYSISGNHDASVDNEWFRTWIDPFGEHTEYSGVEDNLRPYPVEGTWERYSFRVGNILFLMLSDRNDFEPPVGTIRDRQAHGGRPPGAVTVETFEWWKNKVLNEPEESIIITVAHHMLKETTIGSGEWEGYPDRKPFPQGVGDRRYHGYFPEDGEHNKGGTQQRTKQYT